MDTGQGHSQDSLRMAENYVHQRPIKAKFTWLHQGQANILTPSSVLSVVI